VEDKGFSFDFLLFDFDDEEAGDDEDGKVRSCCCFFEFDLLVAELVDKIVDLAVKRNSLFIPIKLICTVDELKKRIILRDRFERLKLCDEKSIIKIATQYQVFQPPHLHCFELDVSSLTPSQATDLIISKVRDLCN
jgi:hypothetical protein